MEKKSELSFGGLKMINQDFLTLDLSNIEEEANAGEIYGLIGYELIKDYDILFNYKTLEITLISPSSFDKYRKKCLGKKK